MTQKATHLETAAAVTGSVQATVDLNTLIDQAISYGALVSGSQKNDLIVAIENHTDVKFLIHSFRDVKSGKKQGKITNSGLTQTSEGLEVLNPGEVKKQANWLLFGERAYSANAKVFLNFVPNWAEESSAVGLYAASHKGGNAYAEYKEKGNSLSDNPKHTRGYTRVDSGNTAFEIKKGWWGTDRPLRVEVSVNDGTREEPASCLFYIHWA